MLVLPDVAAKLFPLRGNHTDAAFGFERAEFDDAQSIAVEHGVGAVACIQNIRIKTCTAHQGVVVLAAFERVVALVADQEVGL